MPVLSDEDWERLVMPMVIKTDDCWYWSGYTCQTGHGFINLPNNPATYVHRLSLARKLGREIESGLQALHSCYKSPNCVNPDHLRVGTAKENMMDKVKDGTMTNGERNGKSKLTEAQVIAIRADTRTQIEIAKEYGISQMTVSDIKRRRKWKHLP